MTLPRKASAFSNQEEQPVQPPQPAPARLSPFWEGKVAKGEPAAGLTQTGGFTGRVIPSLEDPAWRKPRALRNGFYLRTEGNTD